MQVVAIDWDDVAAAANIAFEGTVIIDPPYAYRNYNDVKLDNIYGAYDFTCGFYNIIA